MRSRKFPGLVAAASLVLGLIVGSPITASAGNELNCPGGPIPPGTHDSIDVSGFCLVVGPVTVKHDVTVVGGGVLLALFGAGTLVVGGNMKVESGGSAAVGCEPEHFPCFDSPSGITNDTIAGSVLADHAVLLLFHHDTIGKNVEEHSGGGGLTCASLPAFGPNGPPPYSTYEDDTIGGNAYFGGGLAPGLAADLALNYQDRRDGFGKNLFNGLDVGNSETFAARSKWKAELGDATSATLILDYSHLKGNIPAYRPAFGTLPLTGVPFAGDRPQSASQLFGADR